MEENDEICLGLGLGLGLREYKPRRDNLHKNNKPLFFLDLSIPPHPSDLEVLDSSSILKINIGEDDKQGSKNNNGFSSCNKEDDCINFSKDCSRKKLRLNRDQSTLLEDSFRQHTTLNTAQKQALAEKLNLKPRQVEVWFQNRRARTKLKQTEVDCLLLKKNCERLSEENLRLKKELLELRSSVKTEKSTPLPVPPFLYHIPTAATYKTCPSCEKSSRGGGGVGEQETAAAAAAAPAVMEVVREPNPNDDQEEKKRLE